MWANPIFRRGGPTEKKWIFGLSYENYLLKLGKETITSVDYLWKIPLVLFNNMSELCRAKCWKTRKQTLEGLKREGRSERNEQEEGADCTNMRGVIMCPFIDLGPAKRRKRVMVSGWEGGSDVERRGSPCHLPSSWRTFAAHSYTQPRTQMPTTETRPIRPSGPLKSLLLIRIHTVGPMRTAQCHPANDGKMNRNGGGDWEWGNCDWVVLCCAGQYRQSRKQK